MNDDNPNQALQSHSDESFCFMMIINVFEHSLQLAFGRRLQNILDTSIKSDNHIPYNVSNYILGNE